MANINYEEDVHIDHSSLDIEWLDQPKLLMKYVGYLAKAEKTFDILKEKQGIIKAGLDRKIRLDPEKYGIDNKLTEPMIAAAIILSKKYRKIARQIIEVNYKLKNIKGAVNAIDQHRKKALENLVTLHGQKYFAGPSIPRKLSEEIANKKASQKRSNNSISIKRKKK